MFLFYLNKFNKLKYIKKIFIQKINETKLIYLLLKFLLPVHVPPLFHAVDLQIHVNAGSLNVESEPIHPMQAVALMQPVQLILQAKF